MKLIDYDALEQYAVEYQERHKGNELTRGEFKLIDNFMFECPKTDAIPVKWLREKRVTHPTTDAEILHNSVIRAVLVMWEREQEAR